MMLDQPHFCHVCGQRHDLSGDGQPCGFSTVQRGIRPGCSMSGSLFAPSLGPFIRLMMWQRMLASARFFAFADDLAAVLARMREALPFRLDAFATWRLASGRGLQHNKCVYILLREDGLLARRRRLVGGGRGYCVSLSRGHCWHRHSRAAVG